MDRACFLFNSNWECLNVHNVIHRPASSLHDQPLVNTAALA